MVEEHEFPYPHQYYEEKTGKVICQMCGKPFLTISPRHLKYKHNITLDEYKLRFSDAPLASEEFSLRSVHGKNKDMFKEAVFEPPETTEINIEEIDVDEENVEDDPLVEELEIVKLSEQVVKLDKVQATKKNILTHLSMTFSNVKQDYFIEEKMISGHLKYRFVTDYADPVLRVAFFFPDTFWHNEDVYYDRLRNSKLEEDGWKVVTVRKVNPTLQDIENAIKEVF
jgi:hypothetical protein